MANLPPVVNDGEALVKIPALRIAGWMVDDRDGTTYAYLVVDKRLADAIVPLTSVVEAVEL